MVKWMKPVLLSKGTCYFRPEACVESHCSDCNVKCGHLPFFFYPSLANTPKHSSLSSRQKGSSTLLLFRNQINWKHVLHCKKQQQVWGGSQSVLVIDVKVCCSSCYIRTSMSFRWNSPLGINMVQPCFTPENMLQVYISCPKMVVPRLIYSVHVKFFLFIILILWQVLKG